MGDQERVRVVRVVTERRIPLVDHVCPVCGEHFLGPKRQVYNTTSCANKANYQKHAEERRQARRKRYRQRKATGPAEKASEPR